MTSALRKKLLSLAIRGKLVPQDPADEPASVLLERIRAERESKENASPRRGRGRRSSSDNPPCPKRGTSAGTASAEGTAFDPPFPIPESWVWCRLGNVIEAINGLAFKPTDWKDSGLPIVRIQNLNDSSASFNYTNRQIPDSVHLYGGELLFAWSGTPGTSFGAHIWQHREAALNQHIFKLVFSENLFDKRYLKIALNNLVQRFIEQAHGGVGLAHITRKVFDDIAIPIPPIKEQRRIVEQYEYIATLCECVDQNYSELRSLSVVLKSHILDIAIRGDLVPQNPTDEPASVLLDRIHLTADKPPCPKKGGKTEPIGISDPLFPIPGSWEWTTLGEIGEVVRGTGIKRSDMSETGRPCVRYGEIYTTYSLKTEKVVSFVSEELFRSSKHVQARSVLMTLTGEDRKDIAKTIAYLGVDPIAISGDMLGICPREVEPLYLSFVLNSPWAIERKGKLATGDLVIHISQKSMSCFPVPLPPIAEQRRIVAKVEELFAAVDAMATK